MALTRSRVVVAGGPLAERLSAYAGRDDVVVLALPRGGVPVDQPLPSGTVEQADCTRTLFGRRALDLCRGALALRVLGVTLATREIAEREMQFRGVGIFLHGFNEGVAIEEPYVQDEDGDNVAIAVDKPFEVGDFIVFGSVAGTVETVGVKTTRIRALGGEQVVMSNTELLKQTVSNYKRLRERRIVFGFGVTYATSPDQAAAIPEMVKRIVEESGKLRFDRAHLKAFGESSLDYEVVYIVLDPDFGLYMNEQQRINLSLMRELDAMGVGFAFPTRTVVLDGSAPLRVAQVPAESPVA